ncbi:MULTISPECIES: MarR family winged helix-turn-helix transcriptional regulator [Nocardiaceae]|uniref:Winged helix-turn-helix transcriptional regulator n=1 Tax=Rhodococcoides kroppenstedtii TaxID=293050 RepID=A0ABS7NXN9_9NOCA|nr:MULTISPECIES: MarR family winged helix-turn-helix transcriptional regulator [Rhodococcus]AMY18356.1 putative HTH-type transcriptional regulator YusO [Rhodococcus sp. PBTS 1]MBY6315415.1 winged helix-turn-helix transcriptional regulator [Rhodococcus kroppenstedtii]MBY6322786.1 winged helix-turn-helix transcriptional regulator [Rhodococcus kroppenstedtii]MBY6398607.1 winged helix-turn-helix transcriptional regulator [Rhodococcus kroppenstedtii]
MHSSDRDLGDLTITVARALRRRHLAALEPFGLPPSHGRALKVLARSNGPVRPGYLADRLRIAPRSVTDVVDALVEAGLVRRRPDDTDRRAVLVDLTDDGRALAADVARAQRRASAGLFDVLDEGDQRALEALLGRLVTAVDPS